MINIRNGLFETNSSSCHSISIAPVNNNLKSSLDIMKPDSNGRVVIDAYEFGWGYETYNDCYAKAAYCAIDNKHNEERMEMLVDVIKEMTGAQEIEFNFTTDWDINSTGKEYAYIDHNSLGTSAIAFRSKTTLINFIFSPNSILYIDNDNH